MIFNNFSKKSIIPFALFTNAFLRYVGVAHFALFAFFATFALKIRFVHTKD
jgi:hypothetical protein